MGVKVCVKEIKIEFSIKLNLYTILLTLLYNRVCREHDSSNEIFLLITTFEYLI